MSLETESVICNVHHFLHPEHKLKLENSEVPFWCDGCKEPGISQCYTCVESCNFHLHPYCFQPRRALDHDFFKRCSFRWVESGLQRDGELRIQYCDACGKEAKGFFYHSERGRKDLHPSCANLHRDLALCGMELVLKKVIPFKCNLCGWRKKKRDGSLLWGYVSERETVALHISCMKDRPLEIRSNKEDSSQGSAAQGCDSESLKRRPKLELLVRENKARSEGTRGKIKKALQLAVSIIFAALLGDPVSATVALIMSLLSG